MTGIVHVAVDGGGSKTAMVAVDKTGAVVARHETSTSNAAVIGHDAAGATLRAGLESVLSTLPGVTEFASGWFGLSGSDRPEDHVRLRPFVEPLVRSVRMTNDAELVLGALTGGIGVAAVSGTGSIAFGRNASGERARAGGWGHVFGDEGSGYDLSRRMLDAFARSVDGRGPETVLVERLMAHLNLAEPFQLIAWVYNPATTKRDLAALSTMVVEAAGDGDDVARNIIQLSAIELAIDIDAVGRRLGFTASLPLACTGGNLVHVEAFRKHVLSWLGERWRDIDLHLVIDPALPAAQSLVATPSPTGVPA